MPESVSETYFLAVFLVLAVSKGVVEVYAYRHQNRSGGAQSGQVVSILLIVLGLLTPILILIEIVVLRHTVPLGLSLTCGTAYLCLLVLRSLAVKALGPYYSVNIRILDDQRLVTTGAYERIRHPIYLVGLLENALYPLACGAYVSAAILVLFGTPVILVRRAEEERQLAQKFGDDYERYKQRTWF